MNPDLDVAAITNHVVNQLAYSRLSSNPLTAILNNLPAEAKKDLTKPELRRILEATACIGTIARQGKDAAGKPLESEYYYVHEHDADESRRLAVTDGLRKPSLRACRKQHKVGGTLIVFPLFSSALGGHKAHSLGPHSNITGSGPRHPDAGRLGSAALDYLSLPPRIGLSPSSTAGKGCGDANSVVF
jgi:hypothetical protein